jgi:PadR family transcriptional regulator
MRAFEIQNLTKNCNETLILAVLYGGRKHGYQLAVELEEASDGFFVFKHGTLYPILHKLEKDGLIRGTWSSDHPGRKRKYYKLTDKGRRLLVQNKTAWRMFSNKLFNVLAEVEE